jgi:hypothetical protein
LFAFITVNFLLVVVCAQHKRKIDGQTVREKDFFGALMASKVEQDELDNALTGLGLLSR